MLVNEIILDVQKVIWYYSSFEKGMQMDQEISVSTPESIEFSHEPAGIGSRFVAGIIDIVLQAAIIFVVVLIFGMRLPLPGSFSTLLSTWASVAAILLIFLVFWGYYIFFEMLWNGQTPGKRTARIRVLKDGGYPIGFLDSTVRNLIRPVDFLPFFYGTGVVVIFCNSRFKRIGDFAAGTIVVKERLIEVPRSLSSSTINLQEDAAFYGHKFNIYKLSDADFNVVRQFIIRRHSIQKVARSVLARKIARPLTKKLGLRPELIVGREEEFLEKLARIYGDDRSGIS